MKILYFTATGNSLYAARQIGGEQLSIPQLIKEGNYEVKDDAVGIVCPVYCGNIPKMVRRFLAKATIRTASEKDIDGQIRRIKKNIAERKKEKISVSLKQKAAMAVIGRTMEKPILADTAAQKYPELSAECDPSAG